MEHQYVVVSENYRSKTVRHHRVQCTKVVVPVDFVLQHEHRNQGEKGHN